MMQVHLEMGRRVMVTGEESSYHFHGASVSKLQGLVAIGYGTTRTNTVRRGPYGACIDLRRGKRLVAELERGATSFDCEDEDGEPLLIRIG